MEPFDNWGEKIIPETPWLTNEGQYCQMWRNAEITEGLVFLRCRICNQPFAVFKALFQKELACPYCKGKADYERDQGKFLAAVLKDLLRMNGKRKKLK